MFLGLALSKQGKRDEATKPYLAATEIKPKEPLAWQGLISLYDEQGGARLDEYRRAAVQLALIYEEL